MASAQAEGFEVVADEADEADAAAEAEAEAEEEVNHVSCGSGCVGASVVCVCGPS